MFLEVEVNFRPTVSRPVYLGVGLPSGPHEQICVVSWCGAPSLTRGWVYNLLVQLLRGLASAFTLASKSRRTHAHILLSHIRLPPTWRSRPPYLYPPGTWWPSYTPGHWVPFSSPLTTLRASVEVFWPASTRFWRSCQSQSQSYITTDGQSDILSWCPAPIWDPRPIFLLSLIILRQLRIFWCEALSLTRGNEYRLKLIGLTVAVATTRTTETRMVPEVYTGCTPSE
jgi:hypothetical protein